MKKGIIMGAVLTGTGGLLVIAGYAVRAVNMRKYSPKPINENHLFRSEVGDEYNDNACVDLKNKQSEFSKREFNRYSE